MKKRTFHQHYFKNREMCKFYLETQDTPVILQNLLPFFNEELKEKIQQIYERDLKYLNRKQNLKETYPSYEYIFLKNNIDDLKKSYSNPFYAMRQIFRFQYQKNITYNDLDILRALERKYSSAENFYREKNKKPSWFDSFRFRVNPING